jgi:hypothetical protein
MFGCSGNDIDKQVQQEMVDGTLHLMNPEQPLNGNITLEIEKIREINPYEEEIFGLRWINFKRDIDGEVMFFNPRGSEVHRFNSDGKYLGNLIRQGQGPGEFSNNQFLNPFFADNQIIVTGGHKVSIFRKDGSFVDESRIEEYPRLCVDSSRFIVQKREGRNPDWMVKILLLDLASEPNEVPFYQASKVGVFLKPGGGGAYGNEWGTPDILYTYDNLNQRVYLCLNTEYKVLTKNLSGETLFVIQKPCERINVNYEEKKEILKEFLANELFNWTIDVFPDTLVAIKNIKILPNGYFALYRVTGVNAYEIDIFSPEGHYIYSVNPLDEIDLAEVKFSSSGFARIKTKEDGFMIYEEYRIKNLPEIFGN